MNALESDAPLIVFVDIKSPYAFAAIGPTLALEAELELRFDWRPLTLDIPSYLGSARKSKGKVVESTRSSNQWSWVKYAYRDARRYVERQGYMLKGTEKIWDSSIPNIAILWVMQTDRERLGEYFAAVYPSFWRRELDIEDMAVVETCLEQAGIDSRGFAEFARGEGRRQHDKLQPQLHPGGIYGVPTYVIDNVILFGREHLPYIRWHLKGRKGPAPDIAYEIDDLQAGIVGAAPC
ncbi:DsbA family protein [Sphingorhabdus sp. Alg231-15]|uniref:DsbA family protein n=1 Tax=Sphingorhabdus sp. Alg231-15 TaxID=1922222 RepID=UPI000D5538F7